MERINTEEKRVSRPVSPAPPPPPPSTPAPPLTPKQYPFLSPMSGLHTILGKKANRSSSLSQVINYFDSSPSVSDHSMSLLGSPILSSDQTTPKQHASFYNPRQASESSESDSEDDDTYSHNRDQSPEFSETGNLELHRPRSIKGYFGPKRWPDRFKHQNSSSSSGSGLGTGSSSTTSLPGQPDSGRQGSPEPPSTITARASISDVGSEDIPFRKLTVSRNGSENFDARTMSPFPKSLQRVAATLAEESAPTEIEMKREGMLYRYLRDYTPSSPMHSPLDAIPFDLDADEDVIDSQQWWNDSNTNACTSRRESSPSVDPMDNSNPPTRGPSVPPLPGPEMGNRRPSITGSVSGSEQMAISPANTAMPPPMIPQIARMKRKAPADYGWEASGGFKRRAVSPSASPLLSPLAVGTVRERRVLNLQDTHDGLEKMSLQDD